MPCYQVQTASVNLNKADHKLLGKALEKLGYKVMRDGKNFTFSKGSVTGVYKNNTITVTSQSGTKVDTDAMKVAYSEQVIQHLAEKYADEGWEMTKDGDEYVWNKNPGYGAVYA